MTLTHPQTTDGHRREHVLQPLFGLENATISRHQFPEGEMAPDLAYQIVHDEGCSTATRG